METQSWWQRRSWKSKVALIGGLVLAGGVAGATTVSVFEDWIVQVDDLTITGQDLPGDDMQLTVTKTSTGEVLSSDTLPDDTMVFMAEDENGGSTLIGVAPVPDEQAPQAAPPPKKKMKK